MTTQPDAVRDAGDRSSKPPVTDAPFPEQRSPALASLDLAKSRRAEIARALQSVRRRNRIALVALLVSCAIALGGLAGLYAWKAQESSDPIVLKLRSPVWFQNPFDWERPSTSHGPSAEPGAGDAGGPRDAGATGPDGSTVGR